MRCESSTKSVTHCPYRRPVTLMSDQGQQVGLVEAAPTLQLSDTRRRVVRRRDRITLAKQQLLFDASAQSDDPLGQAAVANQRAARPTRQAAS